MSSKERVHSNWRSISIFSEKGSIIRNYPINHTGKLLLSIPRNKRRILNPKSHTDEYIQEIFFSNSNDLSQRCDQNPCQKQKLCLPLIRTETDSDPLNNIEYPFLNSDDTFELSVENFDSLNMQFCDC